MVRGSCFSPRVARTQNAHYRKTKKNKIKNEPFAAKGRPLSDEDYNAMKNQQQQKIDNILERISKSGYSSLTKEEKELLFRSSNKK